jgi:hypothetical protein
MASQEDPRRSRHSWLIQSVNNRVFDVLREIDSEDGEFLCECSNLSCIETIPLTLTEYAALQKEPGRPPLKVPGHPD